MRFQSYFNYILILFLLLCTPCFSMEVIDINDQDSIGSSPKQHTSYRASSLPPEDIPSISTKFDSPTKKTLDHYLKNQNREIISSLLFYFRFREDNSKSGMDDDVVFYTTLDELLMPEYSRKTRALQFGTAVMEGLVPGALGPLSMYLCSKLFENFPVGPGSYALVGTVIGTTILPFMTHGWNIAGEMGRYAFDDTGLTPTPGRKDAKPHIEPEKHPILSRCLSGAGAVPRTLIFSLLFMDAEQFFPRLRWVFNVPLVLFMAKKTYDDSMMFWRRYADNKRVAEDVNLGQQQKILDRSLETIKEIVNQEESDDLVHLIHTQIAEKLKAQSAAKKRKESLHTRLKEIFICNAGVLVSDPALRQELKAILKNHSKRISNNSSNFGDVFNYVSSSQSLDNPNLQVANKVIEYIKNKVDSLQTEEEVSLRTKIADLLDPNPSPSKKEPKGTIDHFGVEIVTITADDAIQDCINKIENFLRDEILRLKLEKIINLSNQEIHNFILGEIEQYLKDKEKTALFRQINDLITQHQNFKEKGSTGFNQNLLRFHPRKPRSNTQKVENFNIQFRSENIESLIEAIDLCIQRNIRDVRLKKEYKNKILFNKTANDFLKNLLDEESKENFIREVARYLSINGFKESSSSVEDQPHPLQDRVYNELIYRLASAFVRQVTDYLISKDTAYAKISVRPYITHLKSKKNREDLENKLFSVLTEKTNKNKVERIIKKIKTSFENGSLDEFPPQLDLYEPICFVLNNLGNPETETNQVFVEAISDFLHQALGKIKLDNGLYVRQEDTWISAWSSLFIKVPQNVKFAHSITEPLEKLTKQPRAQEETPLISEEMTNGDTSIEVVREMQEMLKPIDNITHFHRLVNKFKPSWTDGFLKKIANVSLGSATLGRMAMTYWAVEKVLSYSGLDEKYISGIAGGVGAVDAITRLFQEWYLQENAAIEAKTLFSRSRSFWFLQGVTDVFSIGDGAFLALPAVAILFELFPDSPLPLKVALAAATCPAEFGSFFEFLKKNWRRFITATTTQCVSTVAQERAQLNQWINWLQKQIPALDKETTERLFYHTQDALVMD